MIRIRRYRAGDAAEVGRLIADTYTTYNLPFLTPEERPAFLGPFQYAGSERTEHRDAISAAIKASQVLVAEQDGEIVGVLRGRPDKLQSLFVRGDCHRKGIGRRLVEAFEAACRGHGSHEIKVQATLFAVAFYQALGYRKTTGVRAMRSFDGRGLPYQPMKKSLSG